MMSGGNPGMGGGASNSPWAQGAGLGAGLGGALGGAMYNWFGNWQNPAKGAQSYYGQIAPNTSQYYNPYIQSGQAALPALQGQYNSLMSDPGGMYSHVANNFQASPGYQFALGQGLNASENSAAAGGMGGTPQAQQNAANVSTGLANQNYYQYMNSALPSYMGMYGMGLQGEQGLAGMGQMAGNQYGNLYANAMASQGNLAYSGQNAYNQQQQNAYGSEGAGLGGMLGGLAGWAFNKF